MRMLERRKFLLSHSPFLVSFSTSKSFSLFGLKNLPPWWTYHTAQYKGRKRKRYVCGRIFSDKIGEKAKLEKTQSKTLFQDHFEKSKSQQFKGNLPNLLRNNHKLEFLSVKKEWHYCIKYNWRILFMFFSQLVKWRL